MSFGRFSAFRDLHERILKGVVELRQNAKLHVVLIDDTKIASVDDVNPVLADYTTARPKDAPAITVDAKKTKWITVRITGSNPPAYKYVEVPDIRSYVGDARLETSVRIRGEPPYVWFDHVDWFRIPGVTRVSQALIFDGNKEGEPCLFFVDLVSSTGSLFDLDRNPLWLHSSATEAYAVFGAENS